MDTTGVQLSSDVWSNELLNAAAGGNGSPGDDDIQGGSRNSSNGGSSMVEQLTEEERKLAEALVAVQFVQHSGRHPIINDLSHIAKVNIFKHISLYQHIIICIDSKSPLMF